MNEVIRYSDAELDLFKIRIEQMMEKDKINLQYLVDQLTDLGENGGGEGDWMDGSSSSTTREMLNTMEGRQRRHIWDLDKALVRIKNRTYGLCIVTREKIDTKRLMAVPTTTKSLAAKTGGVTSLVKNKKRGVVEVSNGLKSKAIISRIGATIKVGSVKKILGDSEGEDEEDYVDMDELSTKDLEA
ncbi:MAG: RNA polymerase-binding transcription factor DksA [Salibacteraceae bacterium]|jgi:RNA polymerase-binding transcription factor DksA